MLEHSLSTKICKRVLTHILEQPAWSTTRLARAIKAPEEYVQRVLAGEQSLQVGELNLLAKAFAIDSAELVFASMRREHFLPKDGGLYDLGVVEMQRHREFKKVMAKKPAKPREPRTSSKSLRA